MVTRKGRLKGLHILRSKCILKHVFKGKMWRSGRTRRNICSYWIILIKTEDRRTCKRKHWIAPSGELAWEGSQDLMQDRLHNEWI